MKLASTILVVIAALAASTALATSDGRDEFERGRRFFEAEEYDAALPEFRAAYEMSGHRPSTILALAQTERALKMYEVALEHFREYLATNPDDRADVEATIGLVEELRDAQKSGRKTEATPLPPPTIQPEPPPAESASTETSATAETPPPAEEDRSILKSPVFWIITGAVLVGGGVAIGLAAASGDDPLYGGTTNVVLYP